MKVFKRAADRTLGRLARAIFRLVVHPLILFNYRVTVIGRDEALATPKGAILIGKHISRLDGPLIMDIMWPAAHVRPAVWHAEYAHWLLWPFMKLFAAVALGSPKDLPKEERERRKRKALAIMRKILSADHHLLIFPEGGISEDGICRIAPYFHGTYDLIAGHPDKPIVFFKILGLEQSFFGKRFNKREFLKRIPVTVEVSRVDQVNLHGGPAALNKRIEDFFNHGVSVQ